MNRRQFLLLSTLTTLLTACGKSTQAATEQKDDKTGRSETVLVIGAGISGLAAANNLSRQGYNVTVLEARDRIGGRIWTSRVWDDIPVDLGASWIHGTQRNPLTDLADEVGAVRSQTTNYDNSVVYDTNGTVLNSDSEEEMYELFEQLAAIVENNAERHQTLAEAIQTSNLWHSLNSRQQQQVLHLINTTIEHEFSGSYRELSAYNLDDAEAYNGGDVIFPNGYGQLTDFLASGLDIRLNQIVQKISHSPEGVIVRSNQGEFSADRVVVTLPIGVLKSGQVNFEPPLPQTKQQAISAIGSGLLNKLFLRFPYPFWDTNTEIINWISQEHGRWNEWLNVAFYIDKPVLLGFNAADYAKKTEGWSDEEIIEDAMAVLRTIYGRNIPQPESWQLTRWHRDPYALGAYSFNGISDGIPASIRSRQALAQPINQRLFFAGEATSEDFPATVHGAYISGLIAAEQISDL